MDNSCCRHVKSCRVAISAGGHCIITDIDVVTSLRVQSLLSLTAAPIVGDDLMNLRRRETRFDSGGRTNHRTRLAGPMLAMHGGHGADGRSRAAGGGAAADLDWEKASRRHPQAKVEATLNQLVGVVTTSVVNREALRVLLRRADCNLETAINQCVHGSGVVCGPPL